MHDILENQFNLCKVISHSIADDTVKKLYTYSIKGKMIRGSLVKLGYELIHGKADASISQELDKIGVAMELFQSALLIHDDIMDKGLVRRGAPSMHMAYQADLSKANYIDPAHNGEAMAICSGDIAFFIAFNVLASLNIEAQILSQITKLASQELLYVGMAQIKDVIHGASLDDISKDDIINLYKYKTGRYTFSMPLMLGAQIAKASYTELACLEQAGEALGVVFQLKDDELGIYSNEAELGKPIASDIQENKKTLFRLMLYEQADKNIRERMDKIFGHQASYEDICYIRQNIESLGIRHTINNMMKDYSQNAKLIAQAILDKADPCIAKIFLELMDYSLSRSS